MESLTSSLSRVCLGPSSALATGLRQQMSAKPAAAVGFSVQAAPMFTR